MYLAIALLDAGYGSRAARRELDLYFDSLRADDSLDMSPLALYCIYLLHKEANLPQKLAKLQTADALAAFRCFPVLASLWLTPDDSIDHQLLAGESLEGGDADEDEDELDLSLDPSPSDPETQWRTAKENHGIESKAMDKLMQLTGMHEVKVRAVSVCKEVLLSRKRPADIQAQVTMNFLFGE